MAFKFLSAFDFWVFPVGELPGPRGLWMYHQSVLRFVVTFVKEGQKTKQKRKSEVFSLAFF